MLDRTFKNIDVELIKRSAFLLVFTVLVILFFYGPIVKLFELSLNNYLYSHITFIPLVSAFLFYINRKTIFVDIRYSFYPGILLLALGVLLHTLGEKSSTRLNDNDYLSVMIFAALTCWAGGFVSFYGAHVFRKAIFPIFFLLFMVPIPTPLLDVVVSLLQRGSTAMAFGIFKLTGIPVFREGFTFHLPDLSLEVASACSGIRSSIALLITSILAGHLFLEKAWSKVLLVISIYPITIFKNGLRIVVLGLFASYVDRRILSGWLHTSGGIPFFVLALGFLGSVLWGLRKIEKKVSRRERLDYRSESQSLKRTA